MQKGRCKFYNGLMNDFCDKNIRYESFTNGERFGILQNIPCFEKNNVNNCQLREFYSEKEIKQHDEIIKKRMAAMTTAIAIIKDENNVDIEWECPTNKNDSKHGIIECPMCKGKLHYSISGFNGHIWGKCETEGCLSWMM